MRDYTALSELLLPAGFDDEPACVCCGCTENNACVDGTGIPCHWHQLDPPLCSSCAGLMAAAKLADQRDALLSQHGGLPNHARPVP